jgi:hypothetical protein
MNLPLTIFQPSRRRFPVSQSRWFYRRNYRYFVPVIGVFLTTTSTTTIHHHLAAFSGTIPTARAFSIPTRPLYLPPTHWYYQNNSNKYSNRQVLLNRITNIMPSTRSSSTSTSSTSADNSKTKLMSIPKERVEQNDDVVDDGTKNVSVITTIEPSMKIQEPENVTAPVTPSSTKTTLVSGKKRGRQQQQQQQRNMEPSFATENHDDNDVATDVGSITTTEKKKVKKKATPKSKTVTTVNSSVNSGVGGSLLPLPKKKKNSATTSHQCITERDELPKLWTADMAKANKSYSTCSCCCLLLFVVVMMCFGCYIT